MCLLFWCCAKPLCHCEARIALIVFFFNKLVKLVMTHLSLQWRHNERDSVSNHQPHDCLLNRLFRRRSKKTLKLRVTGLCAGNSPGTGEFPAQMASYAENVSIWWRHHVLLVAAALMEATFHLFWCFHHNILYDFVLYILHCSRILALS